jgi:hypothetical protein
MDPHLEVRCPGLHTHLVSLATGELNRLLPDDLAAEADERLAIDSGEESDRGVAADVSVYQPQGTDVSEGGVAISAPFKLVINVEEITERYIRIIHADDSRLIPSSNSSVLPTRPAPAWSTIWINGPST